jgi:hypothetical protein
MSSTGPALDWTPRPCVPPSRESKEAFLTGLRVFMDGFLADPENTKVLEKASAKRVGKAVAKACREGKPVFSQWIGPPPGAVFFRKLNFPAPPRLTYSSDRKNCRGTFTFWSRDAAGIPVRAELTLAVLGLEGLFKVAILG